MFSYRRYGCVVLAVSFALCLPASLVAADRPVPVAYDLAVTISPVPGSIAVRGKIEVPLESLHAREIQFALHETFAIKQLLVNGQRASFSFKPAEPSPIYPATRNVLVSLPFDIQQREIQIDLEYGGHLKDIPEFGTFPGQKLALDDQINPRLVELANYSSWYPQFFMFGRAIEIKLEVSLPQGWIAVCSGKKLQDRVESGRSITRWFSPKDTDILITASPNYKQRSAHLSDVTIEIYHTHMPEEFIEKEVHQIAEVMQLFTDRLGGTTIPAGTVKHVYSPKRKGQGRAGIARPGMIVSSEGLAREALASNPNFSLFQDVAHEIAHFWWNFGAGQGDWINEAFAEYFSAFAVEKVSSEEQFRTVLENYRKQVQELPANAPSLSAVPFDGSFFVIRYYKSSLLLDYMRHVLGDDSFFRASRDFFRTYSGKSIGTAEFRVYWKQRLGDQKDSLDVWLDSAGGLPELEQKWVIGHAKLAKGNFAFTAHDVICPYSFVGFRGKTRVIPTHGNFQIGLE